MKAPWRKGLEPRATAGALSPHYARTTGCDRGYGRPYSTQYRPAPRAGWSAAQSASGASTFRGRWQGPPGFPPPARPKAPASLSTINGATMRLCRADHPAARASSDLPPTGSPRQARDKQDKLTLRRTEQVRLRSSPAVPRDGCPAARPSPRSRYGVSCIMRASTRRLPRGWGMGNLLRGSKKVGISYPARCKRRRCDCGWIQNSLNLLNTR